MDETMTKSVAISPPNSLVAILEGKGAKIPMDMGPEGAFGSTPSCVVVGVLMADDGPTKIALDDASAFAKRGKPAWTGYIETPKGHIGVWTIAWEEILGMDVPTKLTRIRIWTNRLQEPDEVYIGVGE
jgi:hypothetical protein